MTASRLYHSLGLQQEEGVFVFKEKGRAFKRFCSARGRGGGGGRDDLARRERGCPILCRLTSQKKEERGRMRGITNV